MAFFPLQIQTGDARTEMSSVLWDKMSGFLMFNLISAKTEICPVPITCHVQACGAER